MKKWTAMLLMLVMLASTLVGCTPAATTPAAEATAAPEAATEAPATEAPAKDVNLSFFTGKVETIDLLDQIIADYNAQSNGITVEQEYQQDASNIIKIKFASDAVPDVMTTYEQEFVDQGKYLALNDMSQWWDRLIPSMKESCTDLASGNQYRVCTNMTMAGFFYNKQMFADLGLTPATTMQDLFCRPLTGVSHADSAVTPARWKPSRWPDRSAGALRMPVIRID